MRFAVFHLMPWPYLPDDFVDNEPSAWVTYSNANYDPERGRELYERYLQELVYSEALGFDAVCVNEHHQTAYGLMPSPNLVAMALVQRTSTIKVAMLGNAIPLRDHPLRVAEEVAMLDVISGGRIQCGIVRGIGLEYYSFGINPARSQERFQEAHDLLIAAWTRPGPFAWHSKHYHFSYVNPWPRPLQQPHPPIWLPTQGSASTVRWGAERGYTLFQTFAPLDAVVRTGQQYIDHAHESGLTHDPERLGWTFPIYVGRDDESALEEFAPHVEYLYQKLIHRPPRALLPPGYIDRRAFGAVMASRGHIGAEKPNAAALDGRSEIIVGGPQTVARRLREAITAGGIGTIAPLFHTGTMSHEQTIASMERFAEHVMPLLRDHAPDSAAVSRS
jgi:alkanesulfonate monooxygenase SsuD/methylene tetrahydromethanopterin reductase-like flavin-dependent oxidoreductase (luciferase family)